MLILTEKKPRHRRHQPSSLYELAFDSTFLNLWKLSQLPSLHAEGAFNCKKDSEDYEEYRKKSSDALEKIEKDLEWMGKVPHRVKMKIMAVVSEIDGDMSNFAFDVAGGLTNKTVENIKNCMEHVAVTENFTIDMTESICNIMRVSKLHLSFSKDYLACHCVKQSKVVAVYEQLCAKQKTNLRKMKRCTSKTSVDIALKVFEQLTTNMMTGRAFWRKRRRQDQQERLNKKLRYAEDFHYVAAVGSVDAMKYYYDFTCSKLEDYEIDEHIYQCAQYIFQVDSFTAAKIMFFKKNMSTVIWKRLLNIEFVNIFMTFVKSWRYRHLCKPLFIEVKETMDEITIQNLMKQIATLASDRYQYYDIITTLKEIWSEIPDCMKEHSTIAYTIPELMVPRNDIDSPTTDNLLLSLLHFLKDYTVEMQEEIIGHIIFTLVCTSREEHIETCLKTAQDLGLKSKQGKEYLSKHRFKNLLIDNAAIDYDKVTKYICNNKEEENALKSELVQDNNFILDFLANTTDPLHPFLQWALDEESKIDTFKSRLLAEDLIDDIYQRRLTQFASFSDANKLFDEEILKLNEEQIIEIQSRVKDNSEVLHFALHNYMGSEDYDSDAFFSALSFSEEEEVEFMHEFLHSSDTKEAIYDMLLDLQDFDKSFLRSCEGAHLMLRWHRFIRDMVRPYTDAAAYNTVLTEEKDKVISVLCEKVKKHPKFVSWCTGTRHSSSTSNLHLRFQCFSLLLQREDLELDIKLQKYCKFQIAENGPFMFRIGMNMDGPFNTHQGLII